MGKFALQKERGRVKPFGVQLTPDGVNFALFSKHATDVALCLFEHDSRELIEEIPLDPERNRTGDVWNILIKGLPDQFLYAYRLSKKKGKIFCYFYNPENLLLDPYAKSVVSRKKWGDCDEIYHPLGKFTSPTAFDWEDDYPLRIPLKDIIFYELHVRGFTRDDSSGVEHPGTFQGMIEKIPHLKDLGINAVKIMPIQEYNECEFMRFNPLTGKRLHNYWGYSTVNFFSPMARYAAADPVTEFKRLVKELHKNGIEVILDIVFNHTAEGNVEGPIYSFKGMDPSVYYLMDKKERHLNFTGCGNTVNCNHPIVRQLIRDSLQYWVTEMHVDGFRFDLAAIMMRGLQGEPLDNPPLIEELSQDPILAGTKLIAEPWDCGGLYRLGSFYPKEERWSEWNDQYRDSVRKFIKGDRGAKRDFARRICGSKEIFVNRSPCSSINFVTAHDGFTLRDLVSYNEKHNSSNGEDNRDGNNANYSWNCGYEGATGNLEVLELRKRQMKNFHLSLMISQGLPMIMMGDEYMHTRRGNNNSWCHDNQLNWFLWDMLASNQDYYRFYKGMLAIRSRYEVFRLGHFLTDEDIEWHGIRPGDPDWDGDTQTIAFILKKDDMQFYTAFNTHPESMVFSLPQLPANHAWAVMVNTGNASPNDLYKEEEAPIYGDSTIELTSHSCVMLKSKVKV